MDPIFRRDENSEKSSPHFENQVWATVSGTAYQKYQTDTKIKPTMTPMHAENHYEKEGQLF